MDYAEKVSTATSLISEHNNSASDKIDSDQFLNKLKAMGGTTDEALRECSWEDLQACGLPTILARVVAKIFRSNGEAQTKRAFSRRQVDAMSIQELLRAYDPMESENAVGRRLKAISKGKRCIVFQNGTVAVDPSTLLIDEIRKGFNELAQFQWLGDIYKTYRIGERPSQHFDENPLYPGQPLRTGGICGFTGLDWSGVDYATRQVLYLAVKRTHELSLEIPGTARLVYGWASGDPNIFGSQHKALQEVRRNLPKAAVLYDELDATGSLPSLKIAAAAEAGTMPAGKRVI